MIRSCRPCHKSLAEIHRRRWGFVPPTQVVVNEGDEKRTSGRSGAGPVAQLPVTGQPISDSKSVSARKLMLVGESTSALACWRGIDADRERSWLGRYTPASSLRVPSHVPSGVQA